MSVKKFNFVSPGIFLSEVDNSQLPAIRQAVGPVIIGRTRMGPSMRPVKVESPSEFVQVFGNPVPGAGSGGDVWREGNLTGPTYGAYAAMAYLKAGVGPITMFRLLGEDNPDATGTGVALAGWQTKETLTSTTGGGAYGIFLFPSSSNAQATGTLGAIIYVDSGSVALSGEVVSSLGGGTPGFVGYAAVMESEGQNTQFKLNIFDTAEQSTLAAATVQGSTTPTYTLVSLQNIVIDVDNAGDATATFTTATQAVKPGAAGAYAGAAGTITIEIDNGAPQIITIDVTDTSALLVVNRINATLTGGGALVNGTEVDIRSDSYGLATSEVNVSAGNAATLTDTGISLGSVTGTGNVVDATAVTFAEAKSVIEAAIAGLTVTQAGGGELILTTNSKLGPSSEINVKVASTGLAGLGFSVASTIGGTVPGGSPTYSTAFNFNRNDDLYIRNVLNTNPQMTNDSFVNPSNLKRGENLYWLGESYEQDIIETCTLSSETQAVLLPLASGTLAKDDYKGSFSYAKTGYFFSQDLSSETGSYTTAGQTRLFRVAALDGGRWIQNNLKISIQAIKASTNVADNYGSFNLLVRAASDRDNVVRIVEQWTNLNLNPASENYIGRVIGDTYYEYSYPERTLRQFGQFDNRSKYIRIEMDPEIDGAMMDPALLPFGVTGPLRFKSIPISSGSVIDPGYFALGSGSSPGFPGPYEYSGAVWMGDINLKNLQLDFPKQLLRVSASDGGLADPTDAYFGPMNTEGLNSSRVDPGWGDYLWRKPVGVTQEDSLDGPAATDLVEYSWAVSLDDVVISGSATSYWESGARAAGKSATAQGSWTSVLDAGYDRITAPLYGGFDGLDIKEAEPFRNGVLSAGTPANLDTSNYAFNSIKRAIDTVKDPEFVEANIMTVPGVINASLTQHLIDTCEDRADALAIIDLQDVYTPFTDSTETFQQRNQFTIANAVSTLKTRGINSSYACTYYPWVQILDTISNQLLWVPPSVVALGTLASSEAKSEVWFAPAGFNRGGLTEGAAGWPVTNVTRRLTSKNRDSLYEASINPIATFPSEGIVVFGQKTLQVTRSALDRINVRRLLIYIKKQVSRISSGILFDQNVQVTWNRFLGEVRPFLASVQSRLGLSEWKVILDKTTTTPDLIDQNIMYAKIFLKPARAIEFIAVDFVITRTGASFDD